jgi:hypothetical protein
VEGEAPGYPAAAVRPFNSSCKIEEKQTASRPRYGRVMTLSGFGTPGAKTSYRGQRYTGRNVS